jgi:hypothetical protein
MHENLTKLNAWCNGTNRLHLWVNFQNRTGDWAVRVLTHAWGKAHPIRTCTGTDLEAVCAELLPKAQKTFEEQKLSIERDFKAWEKQNRYNHHRETAEIETMHHTAADF